MASVSSLLRFFAILLLVCAAPHFSAGGDQPPIVPLPTSAESVGKSGQALTENFPDQKKRILLILPVECEQCASELKRLEAAEGPFEALKKSGWGIGKGPENHIQIVDLSSPVDPELAGLVAEFKPGNVPVVVSIEDGKIARSFQRGCTTPLDQWTFGWMMTGNDERPVAFIPEPIQVATTGHYPLRGNHWSIEGNFNASSQEIVHHLRGTHASQLQAAWQIETWSIEELRSLHDDLHEREEGFRGRYAARPTQRSNSGNVFRKPGNAAR